MSEKELEVHNALFRQIVKRFSGLRIGVAQFQEPLLQLCHVVSSISQLHGGPLGKGSWKEEGLLEAAWDESLEEELDPLLLASEEEGSEEA